MAMHVEYTDTSQRIFLWVYYQFMMIIVLEEFRYSFGQVILSVCKSGLESTILFLKNYQSSIRTPPMV